MKHTHYDQAITDRISEYITDLEEERGFSLDDDAFNELGHLVRVAFDATGEADVDAIFDSTLGPEIDWSESFGNDVDRIQRKEGRTLTSQEVQDLYNRQSEEGEPQAEKSWDELNGGEDRSHPSHPRFRDYVAEVVADEMAVETPESADYFESDAKPGSFEADRDRQTALAEAIGDDNT